MPAAEKRIKSPDDLTHFLHCETRQELLRFIEELATSVRGLQRTEVAVPKPESLAQRIIDMLRILQKWVVDIPLQSSSTQRYGNRAFRDWCARLREQCNSLVHKMLSEDSTTLLYLDEIVSYLLDAFGNATRLDYGTGHELHFLVFLYCLHKIGLISKDAFRGITMYVFWEYIVLVRALQSRYHLEPAGSHGVWGLDDFHHLPFIFGSSQLITSTQTNSYPPSVITDTSLIQSRRAENFYFDAVAWVLDNKRGPFHEHSSMLYSISGMNSWEKIFEGMLRMYDGEVLGKFPIMQHFLFGTLCPYDGSHEAL